MHSDQSAVGVSIYYRRYCSRPLRMTVWGSTPLQTHTKHRDGVHWVNLPYTYILRRQINLVCGNVVSLLEHLVSRR